MSKTARLFLYCLIKPVFLTLSNRFFDICFECNLAEVLQFQSASCSLVTHFSFVIICPLMTPDHVCSRSNVGTEKGRGRVRQQDADSCVGVSKTIIIHLKKTHIRYKTPLTFIVASILNIFPPAVRHHLRLHRGTITWQTWWTWR